MSRLNLFGRFRIRVGDTTTHGGVVVTGSETFKEDGIPIARKGDKVTCPRCEPHMFVIAEGLANCLDHGIPIAVEGHVTTCGAKLIAKGSEVVAYATDSSGSMKEDGKTPPKWITFKLDDDGRCEGLKCVVYFDDGSQMSGAFDANNQVTFNNVSGNKAKNVNIAFDVPVSSSSYVDLLLKRIGG
jgi:uncharacterized Zn-binding protein involved in type VI secretion